MENAIANPSPVQVIGRASECLRRLMEAGLTYEALQAPIDDPSLRECLVDFWLAGGELVVELKPTASQKRACEIMGKNFFGVKEAVKHFGVKLTRQQFVVLSEIPFSEAVLEELKDTHILVAVFPLSILEIRGKVDSELFYNNSWYDQESFAKERGKVGWHLVRKTPVDDLTSKNWQEQQALLDKDYEVPSAQVMVYTIISYYLTAGEPLFKYSYVRTSSVDSDGHRVIVGAFADCGLEGLHVSPSRDDERRSLVGVSSARKF